jgi:hypothetical protein
MNFREIFSYLFDRGKDVLNAAVDATTNVVLLQIGDCAHPVVDSDRVEMWCAGPGFVSMPAPPTPGQPSAQVVVLKGGDRDMAIGARDTRQSAVYGNLKSGESAAFATVGAPARMVFKANGAAALITTDNNTPTGNSVYYRVTPTEERFWSPWGSRILDSGGFRMSTTSGARLTLGGLGLPAPFNAVGSFALVTADTVRLDGAIVSIGKENGFCQAVVQAQALQIQLVTLQTELAAIQAAIIASNAAAATSTGYGTGGTLVPLGAAMTALATATSTVNSVLSALATPAAAGTGVATNTTIS